MFMPDQNQGLSEFAVIRAIPELQQKHEFISASLIADYIGCGESTVYRAMKNLMQAGLLTRLDGATRIGGYQYRVEQR